MSIFDKARKKIHETFSSKHDYYCEDVKICERCKLDNVDYAEEQASKSIRNAIVYRCKVAWSVLTDDEKLLIISGLLIIGFCIIVFLNGVKDVPLNILCLNIAESCFTVFCIVFAYFLYRLLRKRIIKSKAFYTIAFILLLLSVPHVPVLCGYSTTQIGDFYEKTEYTEKYYVIMSRKPENETTRTVYKLPAKIERTLDYEGSDDMGNEINSFNYHINKLYFSNGGFLDFDYDYAYEDSEITVLIPNQETKCIDCKDGVYYITLTTEKVK